MHYFGSIQAFTLEPSPFLPAPTASSFASRLRKLAGAESHLTLGGGRLRADLCWKDSGGHRGTGRPVVLSRDSGYFHLFGDTRVEIAVVPDDGEDVPFRVLHGALPHVEYTLRVRDTESGEVRRYFNAAESAPS